MGTLVLYVMNIRRYDFTYNTRILFERPDNGKM